MKKTLSLILAVLTLLSLLTAISCAEKDDSTATTQAAVTENPGESSGATTTTVVFPEKDYGGETFTVYMRNRDATTYRAMYIAYDDNGDDIDNAVFKRNSMVEDKYKIKFEYREASKPQSTVTNDIKNGSVGYDIILTQRNAVYDNITKGSFMDFNKLGLDLTKSWWDKNCVDGYSIQGKQYVMANDVSVAKFNNAYFLYFNKEIIKSFKLDDPYKLFSDGNWLLDTFLQQVKSVSDVKENGEMGTYGMLTGTGASNGTHMQFLTGCGFISTKSASDGSREIVVGENVEKISDIFDKVKTITSDSTCTLGYSAAVAFDPANSSLYANQYDHARALFAQGHFLYLHGSIGISSQFIEMKDDYGVIVNPLYNKDQTEYYHKVDPYALIWVIPNSDSVDTERLAIVMDYWSYASTDTVIPAYYDITIKTKRVSDPTASDMIDKVRATICYEFSDVFKLSVDTYINNGFEQNNVQKCWDSGKGAVEKTMKAMLTKLSTLQ